MIPITIANPMISMIIAVLRLNHLTPPLYHNYNLESVMLSYNLSLYLDTPGQNPTGTMRKEVFKRGEAPLLNTLPLPNKGRGIRGEGC